MPYQVQCHCGSVQAEVDGDLPQEAVSCNCSHCSAKGLVLAAIDRDQLKLRSGEDSLRSYKFNQHAIDHRFCDRCGSQLFSEGMGPNGTALAMINLRCVPEANLSAVKMIPYDGASL